MPAEQVLLADFLGERLGLGSTTGCGKRGGRLCDRRTISMSTPGLAEEAEPLLDLAVRDAPGVGKRGQAHLDDLALARRASCRRRSRMTASSFGS